MSIWPSWFQTKDLKIQHGISIRRVLEVYIVDFWAIFFAFNSTGVRFATLQFKPQRVKKWASLNLLINIKPYFWISTSMFFITFAHQEIVTKTCLVIDLWYYVKSIHPKYQWKCWVLETNSCTNNWFQQVDDIPQINIKGPSQMGLIHL